MLGYLERYQQGEHVQVWRELVALDDQIRTEPLYSEARAVALETMRRARYNIELLVERLQNLGFQFHDPSAVFRPTTPAQLEDLAVFEREVGPVPLSLRAWIEQVGTVYFMGSYRRLSYYAPNTFPPGGFVIGGTGGEPERLDFDDLLQQLSASDVVPTQMTDIFTNMFEQLQEVMNSDAGDGEPGANTAEAIPEEEQTLSDPLVVDFYEVSIEAYQDWQEDYDDDRPFVASIAPDILHKSNFSGYGGYEIALPNSAADAVLLNTEWREMTFVEYLRLSFEWAGFPGLQDYENRDENVLASLREGLLPL